MMLKTSSASLNPATSLFRHFLKKQTPITLLVTAFSLLICPGHLISGLVQSYQYTYDVDMRQDIISNSANYSLFTIAVAVLLTIILLTVNFGFLYSKKAGDMYYSLPVTRNEMLFCGLGAAVIGGIFCLTVGIGSLIAINLLPFWKGVELAAFLKIYGFSIFFILFLATFSLIFFISGGREGDAIISLVGITVGLPAVYLIATYMYVTFAYGVSVEDIESIMYTSPFIYAGLKLLFFVVSSSRSYVPDESDSLSIFTMNWVSFIGVALFTAVFLYIAVRLFKIRKSETAEQGYSFKFMPSILLSLCGIVGGFLIGLILTGGSPFDSVVFWVFYVIGALLCSVAFEAIHTRGFKTAKSAMAKGGVAIAVSVAIMVSAGIVGSKEIHYVPSEEQIQKIIVDDEIVFKDNFDTVLDLHNAILKEYDKYEGTDSPISLFGNNYGYDYEEKPSSPFLSGRYDINIKYVLKDGRVKTRNYNFWDIDYTQVKEEIYTYLISDELVESYYKTISDIDAGGDTWADYSTEYDAYYGGEISADVARLIVDTYMEELRSADMSIFTENCRHFNYSGYEGWFTLVVPESFQKTNDIITLNTEKNSY